MELNVRSSSLYRRYSDDVPLYLRNRPRRIIDDMRKKMRSLQAFEVAGVRLKSPAGVFLVPARGSGRPPHEVVFGSETTCCSCSCQSFQRTQLLCIHFCAVFRALPDWTFNHVSPIYTQSPLLTLDEDILRSGVLSAPTPDEPTTVPSPSLDRLMKAERQKARTLLRGMFEMTYRVDDVSMLQRLVHGLEPLHRDMSAQCSSSQTDSGSKNKRQLQFKRYMLAPPPPSKKQRVMGSGQVNVVEVHVIDSCDVEDEVTASGPTYTV